MKRLLIEQLIISYRTDYNKWATFILHLWKQNSTTLTVIFHSLDRIPTLE